MLLFLGSFGYVPLLFVANSDGQMLPSWILGFARVSLVAQGSAFSIVVGAYSYRIAIDPSDNADVLSILTIVVGVLSLFNLGSLFYGQWIASDGAPRYVAKNEKSMLSLLAIGLTIFGSIMSNFSYSWYAALSSLTPGSDLIVLTLTMFALIFEYVSLALGPALFLTMKWRLGAFMGWPDIYAMFISLALVAASQLVELVERLLNLRYFNVDQFAIIQVFLIVSTILILGACIATFTSAVFVLKSHKMSLLGFVPTNMSDEDDNGEEGPRSFDTTRSFEDNQGHEARKSQTVQESRIFEKFLDKEEAPDFY